MSVQAMRGAASSFGITTKFTVQTFKVPEYAITVNYNWNLDSATAGASLLAFQDFVMSDNVPAYYGGDITLNRGDSRGEISFSFVAGWYGPQDELAEFLQPFLDKMPEPRSADLPGDGTYIGAVNALAEGDPLDTTVGPDSNNTFYTKSLIISEAGMPPYSFFMNYPKEYYQIAPQNLESFTAFAEYLSTVGYDTKLDWFCVSINFVFTSSRYLTSRKFRSKSSCMEGKTLPSRRSLSMLLPLSVVTSCSPSNFMPLLPITRPHTPKTATHFSMTWSRMSPNFLCFLVHILTGLQRATLEPMGANYDHSSYLNYVDDRLENYEQLYYGENLPRLRELKAVLDPNNVFTAPSTVKA